MPVETAFIKHVAWPARLILGGWLLLSPLAVSAQEAPPVPEEITAAPVPENLPAAIPTPAPTARPGEIVPGLRLRGRLQTGWELNSNETSGSWSDGFFVRRARIDGRWMPFDWTQLNLEIELARSGGVRARDVYAAFELLPELELTVGRFKKPFSRLRMTSPFDLWIPERGLLDANAVDSTPYGGFGARDYGVMLSGTLKGPALLGDPLKFSYDLGAFNALPGDADYHRDFVGRAQLRLFKGLVVATNGTLKYYESAGSLKQAFLLGGDIKWELGDFLLQLEGAYGSNVSLGGFLGGAHATAAYTFPLWEGMALTPAVMLEVFDPSHAANEDADLRVAAALNLDVNPQIRLVLSLDKTWEDVLASSATQANPLQMRLHTNLRF
ncbi:MAG: porin [Candidatus Sericytochromatia bacterium]